MTPKLRYQRFDPRTCGFPLPRVPVLPALSRLSLSFTGSALRERANTGNSRSYVRGRYALADAYRLCGVGPGTAILAPAYHCRTMLDPAILLGAEVRFYPLRPNLAVDLTELKTSLASCHRPVSALLVSHFFGFVQALEEVQEFCRSHAIALIEDCCHCAPAVPQTRGVGHLGRYSVWSPYKFYACEDGGTLLAREAADLPTQLPHPAGLTLEIKALARSVRNVCSTENSLSADSRVDNIVDRSTTPDAKGSDLSETSSGHSSQYVPAMQGRKGLAWSRWIVRHSATTRLTALRRQHFKQWLQAVADLPHCRALYPALPDGCVPYMFPLYIERPDVHFYALKRLGVPVWRWDDMAVSGCAWATRYRLHLLHLPCHQELSEAQMTWMMSSVANVMTSTQMEHAA